MLHNWSQFEDAFTEMIPVTNLEVKEHGKNATLIVC